MEKIITPLKYTPTKYYKIIYQIYIILWYSKKKKKSSQFSKQSKITQIKYLYNFFDSRPHDEN